MAGRRYGLIGRNGVGKTTLLRAIARYEVPHFPTHLRVLHVEQEIRASDSTALQCVIEADLERTMLLTEENSLKLIVDQLTPDSGQPGALPGVLLQTQSFVPPSSSQPGPSVIAQLEAATTRLAAVYLRLNEIESWSAEGRAASILSGLQVTLEMQQLPTHQLSGIASPSEVLHLPSEVLYPSPL